MQFIRTYPIISGVVAYVAGVGAVVAYKSGGPQQQLEAGPGKSASAQDMSHGNPTFQANVAHVYDTAAATYDDDIGKEEAVMGIPLFRRWLLRQAQGNVLEVGAGTGRNIQYYRPCPKRQRDDTGCVKSVTMLDPSLPMLGVAARTAQQVWGPPSSPAATVQWRTQVGSSEALPVRAGSYDAVLSTFTLCSVQDLQPALTEMWRAVAPGGVLCLLEHGRSPTWDWLNGRLDAAAPAHAHKWGCWYNRDLQRAIEAFAEHSAATVQHHSTWHFGTTQVWVLRKPAATGDELASLPADLASQSDTRAQ